MRNRFDDALAIQAGACNPSGIAHAIIKACQEMRENPKTSDTDRIRNDPAIRLMVHQLCFLCKVHEIDYGDDVLLYNKLTDHCEEQVNQLKKSEQDSFDDTFNNPT